MPRNHWIVQMFVVLALLLVSAAMVQAAETRKHSSASALEPKVYALTPPGQFP